MVEVQYNNEGKKNRLIAYNTLNDNVNGGKDRSNAQWSKHTILRMATRVCAANSRVGNTPNACG